jgi:hypothetical protein
MLRLHVERIGSIRRVGEQDDADTNSVIPFGCNEDTAKTVAFDACKTLFVNFSSYVAGGLAGTGTVAYLEPYCGKPWASAIGSIVNYLTRYTVQYVGGIVGDKIQKCCGVKSIRFNGFQEQLCFDTSGYLSAMGCGMAGTAISLYLGAPAIKGSTSRSVFGAAIGASCDMAAKAVADLFSPCLGGKLGRVPRHSRKEECEQIFTALAKGLTAGIVSESINMTSMSSTPGNFLSALGVYLSEVDCDLGMLALKRIAEEEPSTQVPSSAGARTARGIRTRRVVLR